MHLQNKKCENMKLVSQKRKIINFLLKLLTAFLNEFMILFLNLLLDFSLKIISLRASALALNPFVVHDPFFKLYTTCDPI